ncbi:MAG: coiled-coil domain-containing protein [Stackebrandtia sp.]
MRRRSVRSALVIAIAAVVSLILPLSSPAFADDDVHKLEKKLEKAAEEYSDAKKDLKKAEKRQKTLKKDIKDGKEKIEKLGSEINDFAEAAYLTGGLPTATAMLAAGSPEEAVDSMSAVTYLGENSADELEDFAEATGELEADQDALEDEIDKAEGAVKKKKKAKEKLEDEIDQISGGPSNGDGGSAGNGPGGGGSCSEDDPTTDGCITPTMLHAYNQARDAGYTRHTSCYRGSGGGEHPKGRACDFAASESGFGEDATGGDQTYGDNLAGWFVNNASALGVYYVIWDNQIWMEGTGWGDYSSGHSGNPSQDHTDHVHLSVN